MSEHEGRARQHDPDEPRHPSRRGGLSRGETSLIRRLTEVLRFADFMAVLMVAATAFSAYATWRTAQVTSHVFAIEERPFIGVERVTFEQGDTANPRVVIDYRNFGKIPAVDAIVTVVAMTDGKRVADLPNEMSSISAGVLSPGVPHFFYRYLPVAVYKAVVEGKSKLMLHVRAEYKGAAEEPFCYSERVVYDYRSAGFRPAGGSDRCRNTDIF
ncbi:MAG TPA: hypothetical protein VFB33_13810 [Candidatus Binataceae bacterium]|jgi:hypothetical protein|nr:hypothetical protein [Candidatus Binataceae bacterium]